MDFTTTNSSGWQNKLPWYVKLNHWAPFKIDALGLVTLLGAEEVNSSIGRLVPSRYLEYLPLLGAYVVANESFKEQKPSFNLYNFADGISTTELAFWLTRWMSEQDFETARSIVRFEVAEKPRSWARWHIVSAVISLVFVGFLIAMTVLIGDWYGFANAIAMTISILVRAYSMQAHRNAIDQAVIKAEAGAAKKAAEKMMALNEALEEAKEDLATDPSNSSLQKAVKEARENVEQGPGSSLLDKKCLMILSDSKAVTIYLPGDLIVPVFSHNPQPLDPVIYHLVRYIGWGAFGVHIISIGMATLIPQMYTVALLLIPTVLTCWKLGCDDSKWKSKFYRRIRRLPLPPQQQRYECWFGTRLKAEVSEWDVDHEFVFVKDKSNDRKGEWRCRPHDADIPPEERSRRRQDLYAWLNLNDFEEKSMGKWDLLPHRRKENKDWWGTYKAKQKLIREKPPPTRPTAISDPTGKSRKGQRTGSSIKSPNAPSTARASNDNTHLTGDLTSNGTVNTKVPTSNVRSADETTSISDPDPDPVFTPPPRTNTHLSASGNVVND